MVVTVVRLGTVWLRFRAPVWPTPGPFGTAFRPTGQRFGPNGPDL